MTISPCGKQKLYEKGKDVVMYDNVIFQVDHFERKLKQH